jgi:hypothetical protein
MSSGREGGNAKKERERCDAFSPHDSSTLGYRSLKWRATMSEERVIQIGIRHLTRFAKEIYRLEKAEDKE